MCLLLNYLKYLSERKNEVFWTVSTKTDGGRSDRGVSYSTTSVAKRHLLTIYKSSRTTVYTGSSMLSRFLYYNNKFADKTEVGP